MELKRLIFSKRLSILQCSKESGVPYATLHDICNGKTPIDKCSYNTLRKLADYLGTSVDRLAEGSAFDQISREELDQRDKQEINESARFDSNGSENPEDSDQKQPGEDAVHSAVIPYYDRFSLSLAYAYSEYYGKEIFQINKKLRVILIDLIRTYLNDSDNRDKAKDILNPILDLFISGKITRIEAYILVIAFCDMIRKEKYKKLLPHERVDMEEWSGIFVFEKYIYALYNMAASYDEYLSREDKQEVKYTVRDLYNEIESNISGSEDVRVYEIKDLETLIGKVIDEVYYLYNGQYIKRLRDNVTERVREFYGINKVFHGEISVVRARLHEVFVKAILYDAIYLDDVNELTVSYEDYRGNRKLLKVATHDEDYKIID